ncbi:hypothetical protein F4825DRAFT_407706 [Nemania diffusa]|nr:hypothetical protein F4825DRAFT_407706 [Nemania diffusa]
MDPRVPASLLAEAIDTRTEASSSEIQHGSHSFLNNNASHLPHAPQSVSDRAPTPHGPGTQTPSEDILGRMKKLETELAEERALHSQINQELERTRKALAETHRRWKDTVKEFNQFQAQTQKFTQLDDQLLVQKVSQLRFNIRNTALRHFAEDRVVLDKNTLPACWEYITPFQPINSHDFETLVYDPQKRSMVVQAVLWAYLTTDIFSQFRWAGNKVAGAFHNLGELMDPLGDTVWPKTLDKDQLEEGRRYATWKANTAALLVEAIGLDRDTGRELQYIFAEEKAAQISDKLRCLSSSRSEHLVGAIRDIIVEALELDLLISRQIAHVDWICGRHIDTWHFRSDFMEPDGNADRYLNLVLAPGLAKSGRSDGEDFGTTVLLLKMQVACGPVDICSQGGSQGTQVHREGFSLFNKMIPGKHRRH